VLAELLIGGGGVGGRRAGRTSRCSGRGLWLGARLEEGQNILAVVD